MEINYFIVLFFIIPFLTVVGFLYYVVNNLCVEHNHEEAQITDARDLPELQEEEKYPEEIELDVVSE